MQIVWDMRNDSSNACRHEQWLDRSRSLNGQMINDWTDHAVWMDKWKMTGQITQNPQRDKWLGTWGMIGQPDVGGKSEWTSKCENKPLLDDGLWTWLVTGQTRTYLGCLLCLQFPDQLTLLWNTLIKTDHAVWMDKWTNHSKSTMTWDMGEEELATGEGAGGGGAVAVGGAIPGL